MSYAKSSLGADEEILMIARFPWPYHLVAWSALLLLGIVGVGILIWALMMVHFATTETALTTRRIVYKKGLFTRETMELGVSTVEQIELHQGFWGRIFGFGVIEVSGTGDSEIRSHPMATPVKFRRLVTDARARDRKLVVEQRAQQTPNGQTRSSRTQKLKPAS
ncbi:PH domain-containing protein [Hyphococcus sp.]|uniref:PH domain-containing protein n=1 Tax=Hyphococcus sp. TaxID=2038636 RepID=UPI0035C77793